MRYNASLVAVDGDAAGRACVDCTYLIGLYGWTAAEYTVTATRIGAAGHRASHTMLQDGVPVSAQVEGGGYRHFDMAVQPTDFGVQLTLSATSGDADLFASFATVEPNASSYSYHSANSGADVLLLSSASAGFCPQGYPCTLHVSIYGYSASQFTLTATQDVAAPTRLFDGAPQVAQAAADEWRFFRFSVAADGGPSEFTVTVSAASGDPDIYISNDGTLPSLAHYAWHADAWGEDAVTVDAHDAAWCAGCDYLIGVKAAQHDATYTVTAATDSAITILEDGVPHQRTTAAGGVHYYRLYVPGGGQTSLRVTLTPLGGLAALYMSTTNPRPNATTSAHTRASDAAPGAPAMISAAHDDAALEVCLAHSGQSVVYVAVVADAATAATYTILANLIVRDTGFTVVSPASLARNYVIGTTSFGGVAPVAGLQSQLALAATWEACGAEPSATALAGKVALVGCGTCAFAEKAWNVQQAGAVALIVANNVPEPPVLGMGGQGDVSSRVTIPVMMLSEDDSSDLHSTLPSPIEVSITDPSRRPTTLRAGRAARRTARSRPRRGAVPAARRQRCLRHLLGDSALVGRRPVRAGQRRRPRRHRRGQRLRLCRRRDGGRRPDPAAPTRSCRAARTRCWWSTRPPPTRRTSSSRRRT